MNELLKIEHARKVYQSRFKGVQVEALKDIQLEVNKGEYTAIMGESGSGKSTLLNMIATLDKPTSGKLYLNGDDLTQIKEKAAAAFRREHLGFVFQDFNLLDTISVKDNILLPLVLSRKSIKVAKPKLQELAEKFRDHYFIRKISVRIIWWTKATCGSRPGDHYRSSTTFSR